VNRNFRSLVVLALLALALHAATFAQDFSPMVRAHIPFPFYAGAKSLPPGDYTLAINRQTRHVAIFEYDKGIGVFLLGSPSDASINGVALLTFQRNSEGVYALQKVQGPDIGVNFPASETSSLRADGRPVNDVQVIVAQVMR